MRRVRLISPPKSGGRPLSWEEFARQTAPAESEAELLYFRHRCEDDWYAELIESKDLQGKKITPARLRRLIVAALKRRQKERE